MAPKTHRMLWYPQDWRTSRVRARSIRTNDPMLRLVYRELLDALYEAGGELPSDPETLADELALPPQEIERCLPILAEIGKHGRGGITVEDGRVRNARVSEDLADEARFRAEQVEIGARGGRRRAASMTPAERSEAARKAANARHKRSDCEADAKPMRSGGYAHATNVLSPPLPPPPPLPSEEEEEESGADAPPAATGPPILQVVDPNGPPKRSRRRREPKPAVPMPEGFPDAALREQLGREFPDLALDDAIEEFRTYVLRDRVRYCEWDKALRNALLRDRGRGLFRKPRAPASAAPAYMPGARTPSRRDWDAWAKRKGEA